MRRLLAWLRRVVVLLRRPVRDPDETSVQQERYWRARERPRGERDHVPWLHRREFRRWDR